MKIQAEIAYPRPPADVSQMIFDPAFQDQKCIATGAVSHSVDVSTQGDRTRVTTDRAMPTDSFPDFLKSFVGSTLTVTEVDEWGPPADDGSRHGTITVTVAGAPLKVNGTMILEPVADGARTTIDADLKASVPLIGGKVEKAAAPAILAAAKAEEKTAASWLAR